MSANSEYLYVIKPSRIEMLSGALTPEEDTAIEAHYKYLKDLAKKGILILSGQTQLTDEKSFGIVIFRSDSDEYAREIMVNDPAVRHGIMHAELYPYQVALMGNCYYKM